MISLARPCFGDRIRRTSRGRVDRRRRLRRAGQPEVIGGIVGCQDDLLAVTFDQAAVLTEHDHPVFLSDDQVAVAGDQVASLELIVLV